MSKIEANNEKKKGVNLLDVIKQKQSAPKFTPNKHQPKFQQSTRYVSPKTSRGQSR